MSTDISDPAPLSSAASASTSVILLSSPVHAPRQFFFDLMIGFVSAAHAPSPAAHVSAAAGSQLSPSTPAAAPALVSAASAPPASDATASIAPAPAPAAHDRVAAATPAPVCPAPAPAAAAPVSPAPAAAGARANDPLAYAAAASVCIPQR